MFPFAISGQVSLPGVQPEQVPALLSRIAEAAREQRAQAIEIGESRVTLRGGQLVTNWNVFASITRGTIEVRAGDPGVVTYHFTCTVMLVLATALSLFFGGVVFAARGFSPVALVAPVVVWLWLFGMNYLLATHRLPAFVRGAIRWG
jgi:hypothetical protein